MNFSLHLFWRWKIYLCNKAHRDTTAQEIIDWCHENMAVYKAPRAVQFADALPKSGAGKVMRRALQEAESSA